MLFDLIEKEFWTTRLTKKGMFKVAKDLMEEHPQVFPFLQTFFHHKNNLPRTIEHVYFREMEMTTFSIDPKSWRFKDEEKLTFGLVDMRDVITSPKCSFPSEEPPPFFFFSGYFGP
ncbi:MAG TPA: hypothetical protein VEQ18_05810 [Candidatus Nitrosocosmicus sp.]|nr:hypothetical protein [Candidatus Nitrosocosmicus sp.]